MKYTPQKYSFLELFFHNYKWARRLSGKFWVKLEEPGYEWVKFDKAEFEAMVFLPNTQLDIEDYTCN